MTTAVAEAASASVAAPQVSLLVFQQAFYGRRLGSRKEGTTRHTRNMGDQAFAYCRLRAPGHMVTTLWISIGSRRERDIIVLGRAANLLMICVAVGLLSGCGKGGLIFGPCDEEPVFTVYSPGNANAVSVTKSMCGATTRDAYLIDIAKNEPHAKKTRLAATDDAPHILWDEGNLLVFGKKYKTATSIDKWGAVSVRYYDSLPKMSDDGDAEAPLE